MNDVVGITGQKEMQKLSERNFFSLGLKAFVVLVISVLPLASACGFAAYIWNSGASSPLLSEIISGRMTINGFSIPIVYLVIGALSLVGICLGYLLLDHFFISPPRKLLAWLSVGRATEFTQVPLLPYLQHDEFGELGRLLASSAALFSETKQQNGVLMEEKTLFMTIAAHQLRTPLTGLLWSIEALLDPETKPDIRQKLMVDIDGLLKRMRLIVNHILASANVEGGRYGYVFEKIDIAPVIEKLISEFKPVSDNHGVTLVFEHPTPLLPVYADQERITLALFDLIENAIDYTPKGGTITVSAIPSAKQLEVSIADTGIGISPSEISSLFNRFYRSDRARRMRPDGSGLGLFLVKNIIESHGSDIKVASQEGNGSRFSFFLDSQKKPA